MEIQRFAAYGMIAASIGLSHVLRSYCGLDFEAMFWTFPTVFLAVIIGFLGGLIFLIDAIAFEITFYIENREE